MKNKKVFIICVIIITLIIEIFLFYNYFKYVNMQKDKEKQIVHDIYADEINKDSKTNDLYNELYFDIIIKKCNEFGRKNGIVTNFNCELINSVKKKKYYITFNSSYLNTKNRATIKMENLSSEEINDILDKYKKNKFEKLSTVLDSIISGDYKVNLIYLNIDNIKYDIFIDKKINTLKDNNGDNGTQYVYKLVNTIEKAKYTIYCNNYVDAYNNKGIPDEIVVDITYLNDDELNSIIKHNTLGTTLKDFEELIKTHFSNEYQIDINYSNR